MGPQDQHDRCETSQPAVGRTVGKLARWVPLVFVLILIPLVSPNFHSISGERRGPLGGDFLQEWIGGRIVLEGQASQLYRSDLATRWQHETERVGFAMAGDRYFPMVYPLTYYAAMTPLAMLPYPTALFVWYALMAVATCLGVALTVRVVGGEVGRWLPVIAALFAPLLLSMNGGQKAGVILALFAAATLLLRNGRHFTAGCVAGLLLLKPPLALGWLAIALVQRDVRFLTGSALVGGLIVTSSLRISVEATADYARFLLGAADYIRSSGYDHAGSHSWYSFAVATLGISWSSKAFTLAACAATLLLAAGAWPIRDLQRRQAMDGDRSGADARATCGSTASLAALLVSPHLMTYDLAAMLLPWAWGLQLLRRDRSSRGRRRMLLWLLPFASAGIASSLHTWIQVPLMPLLMLLMLIELRRVGGLSHSSTECHEGSARVHSRLAPIMTR